ncbi:MAG: hypothetical protein GQ583_02285 [Methyloprofundus sp.]|nr:hypothetical protein [Methyloprofundus sp.]
MKIQKKFTPLIFIVGLVALILFQNKTVMPTVEKIAASGLFLEDSGDEGSRIATTTNMTNYAFIHCNKAIREEIDSEINIIFPTEPLQSWTLGNYKYIVNAEIEVSSADGSSFFKKYACHIQYDEGSNQEGVMDSDNWTINGLSGISGT